MPFPRRPLLSGLVFLLTLLAALYAVVLFGSSLSVRYPALSFLPDRTLLPFLGGTAAEAAPVLTDSMLLQLAALDELQARLDAEPVEAEDPAELPPALPPIPTTDRVTPIEASGEALEQLQPFFRALVGLRGGQGQQVRILHYGDSQIEGDRITSFLRSRLQNSFGGAGSGLISPVSPTYPPYGLKITASSNLELHSVVPATQRVKGAPYGIMGSYCEMTDPLIDTVDGRSDYPLQTEIVIKREAKGGRTIRFSQLHVLLRNPGSTTEAVVRCNLTDTVIARVSALASPNVQDLQLEIPSEAMDFTLECFSDRPPQLYALSFQTPTGVIVDNIPLRGSSGTEFRHFNDTVLRQSANLLRPMLLILQFGVNVVPNKLDDYTFYTNALVSHINYLKQVFPGVAIVLIGVTDMAEKVGAHFRTYSNIGLIRAAQRRAAQRAKIAYWDSFTAMGGENAIVSWVNATPPLANPDYTHFTPRGARFFSELFYAALIKMYEESVNP